MTIGSAATGRCGASVWLLAASVYFPLAACSSPGSTSDRPAILLFAGHGTSLNDVTAVERILNEHHLSYAAADSARLNAMSESDLGAYRLLIVPGGNFEEMGNSLDRATPVRVRNAVGSGLNYLGICAGAFIAGNSPYNGFNLTSGVKFTFYAAEARGIRKAAIPIARPGSAAFEHYWEDGPQLSGWGDVVGKYPDGTPAIVQGTAGDGWVILTGVHPEAPENWRGGMTFATPASVDNAYAATLIDAALNRKRLAHY